MSTRLTCSAEESVCRDGSELMTVHIDGRQTYDAGTGLIQKAAPSLQPRLLRMC